MNSVKQMQSETRYWHTLDSGSLRCDLCPRYCELKEGQRGLCFVRKNEKRQMQLTTYGRSSGFCIDPVEKKPLYHFFPGSPVLSFGTAGCNLTCKFCQNWDMSKSRGMDKLQVSASPQAIAEAALANGCKSVAYTYNDPVIFLEYAVETAKACAERGIKSIAVTAGYICKEPAVEFFSVMDAVNIDLKGFSNQFYKNLCSAELQPVLDTLIYLVHETAAWVEITNLIIPGQNDSSAEIKAMTQWIAANLGPEIPIHFSAFHPDYKMLDIPRTSLDSLISAREIALNNCLKFVYTGNVVYPEGGKTRCSGCDSVLIQRSGYTISHWKLGKAGKCEVCGKDLPGEFESEPGTWGSRYERVNMKSFES